MNLAGTPVVVVNSSEAAHELFEKKSSLYSDRYVCFGLFEGDYVLNARFYRVRLPMLNELYVLAALS